MKERKREGSSGGLALGDWVGDGKGVGEGE